MFSSIGAKVIIPVCIVTGIALIAFLSLPFLIDLLVLPRLLEKTVFSSPAASISRLTPYELSGSVDLEHLEKPSVSIPRFKLRFTPGALLNRDIDSLELTNAVFHLYREQGRWVIPGASGRQSPPSDSRSADQLLLLPVGVDTLLLDQCHIVIHDDSGRHLHVGINGRIEPTFTGEETGRRLESIQGSLQLFDDVAATISFGIAPRDDRLEARLDMENGTILLPGSMLPEVLKPLAFDALSARLHIEVDAESLKVKHYDLNGTLMGLHYTYGQLGVGDGSDDGVSFALNGTDQDHTYKITALSLNAPVPAEISLDGTASYRDGQLLATGHIESVLFSTSGADTSGISLSLQYDGNWSRNSGYQLTASGAYRPSRPVMLSGDSLIMDLDSLQFSGVIDGGVHRTSARFNLAGAPLTLSYDGRRIQTSAFDLAATVTRIDDDIAARLTGSFPSIELPEYNARLEGLRFNLPYQTTTASTDDFTEGRIAIESLLMNGEKLASLSVSITQRDGTYTGSGSIEALFRPDARLSFNAEASIFTGTGYIEWDLEPTPITPESLPGSIPLPVDLDFSGVLTASGRVAMDSFAVSADVQTSIRDASLELSDSGLAIEEINCTVEFPELPRLLSKPSQYCSTGSIDLASLHFDDAEIYFRVEDNRSVFIEKSRLSWCDGRLDSGSIRLSPDIPVIDTTLYCSRIKLGSLLEQLGFSGTEGEGALNGTLPVRVSKNRLEFDDGFLFSTPGTGGIVRFTDTELLRKGMGAVSETGYISYSLAALEDFTYNWTKLTFDSSEDDLLLTLELDGKPTTPLPFTFDKKGMIVESSKGQGLQYPIRLDVNFRLPLSELFQIGQSINSLMGNSQ